MAGLLDIRDALASRIATISGLRVFDTVPAQISPPAAVVTPGRKEFLTYGTTFEGSADYLMTVLLLVSEANDRAGQDLMDGYLATTGAASVYAAIQADPTLGGVVNFAALMTAANYGLMEYAGIQYLSCELTVQIGAI